MSLEKLAQIVESDLRDEFAKAALTGMLAYDSSASVGFITLAQRAYDAADAMFEERAKRLKPKGGQ